MVVCQQPRKMRGHKCVIYATGQVASHNSKTTGPISTKLTYFSACIYHTFIYRTSGTSGYLEVGMGGNDFLTHDHDYCTFNLS